MSTQQRDTLEEALPELHKQNPGATLRMEREKQGLTTAAAAGTLRLPEKILVHLEAGRFDQLPGETFARGYVRSYASMLGLDPTRLVLEYDNYVGVVVRERSVSGIDKLTPPGKTGHLLVTWSSVIIALVILASVLVWWYDSRPVQGAAEEASTADQLIDEVEVDALALPGNMAEDMQRQAEAAAESEQPALIMGEPSLTADSSVPASSASEVESATAPLVQPAAEPTLQSVTSASAAGGLQMRFSGNCWLQVTAVGGQVLHSSLMQQGQALSLDHAGPVDLVIGAIESVAQIEYRGQPVDMQSYSQSGVVRLRLGQ
ncbi:RodZ domain-containing protein [Halopseudomonas pelagia]|uniref:RodZ domain-containing protein n=1 Tax=Halopseudomonas pelagia TaxID=553151 RepID=UPI0030DB8B0C|tara:strand:+ start:41848 stop:42798 length:951 start_codon:yes stop_codon:yes gene_type:complete